MAVGSEAMPNTKVRGWEEDDEDEDEDEGEDEEEA